ncbi:porin family protein [Mangrovimonas xylaniphaga]|uniref:porin family protein n=1 Tax=Mangrovimonas xylaniphaga TaxID=1645915 RepID=UPI0006B43C0A|nr:porin family protein [Mangrovimonas xylaniphaga]
MKHLLTAFFIVCFSGFGFSQVLPDSVVVDTKYREDQFYAGVTYNWLVKEPSGLSQTGFSYGLHLGFVRDMPINKRRNVAFGLGLGFAFNNYRQNMAIINEPNRGFNYSIIDDSENPYSKNKFSTYVIEVPFEIRWRTSTAQSYSFWRIYTGFKLGYVFYDTSRYEGSLGTFKYKNNDDFNAFQYGVTLSAGYDDFNLHLYYGLNSIFGDVRVDNEALDMTTLKIGLMFYFL